MTNVIAKWTVEEAQDEVDDFIRSNDWADTGVAYLDIDELVDLSHAVAVSRGWYHDPATGLSKARNFGEIVALMHSELSEALEADRKQLMSDHIPEFTGVEEEFADALIRIFDTAGAMKLRLGEAFNAKLRYNLTRADHSLEARSQTGGKAY